VESEVDVYARSQKALQDELARREAEHQAAVANAARAFVGGTKPLIGVADGDSWFDYPLPLLDPKDVRDSLADIGVPRPIILKLAYVGAATTALLGVEKRNRLIAALKNPLNGPIDFIMFSGGGDDLVGNQFRFWLRDAGAAQGDPRGGVNHELLADILGVVLAAYADLAQIRQQYAPQALLLVHAYDFAIPTGIGVCPSVGPWLKPSLDDRGWTGLADGSDIVRQILIEFKQRLQAFCATVPNAVCVDTQGTLAANEWANELHPTPEGFLRIAEKFRAALSLKFPGRI
jgi:hypothetical protein